MSPQTSVDARLRAAGLRAHPLWIAPPWVIEAVGKVQLDATRWIEQVKDAGIQSLLLITKQHDGRCIWPTRLDALQTDADFLGAICREARRADIKIFAYYSVAIDDDQVRRHPEWAFIDAQGHGCDDIGFRWACLNSPYGDFALAQIEEILTGYSVDALWLDILALGPRGRDCFCAHCQRRYAKEHGRSLKDILGTPAVGAWKVETLARFLGRVHALRAAHRPDALVAFNGAGPGFRRHPEAGIAGKQLFELVDFLSDEGHTPRHESVIAKAMRAHGKAFEILTSNGIANEWVGWEDKPPNLVSLEAAVVGAHGGSFGLGLSVLPGGDLPRGELAGIRETANFLAERRPWFGRQEAVADVRVLIQPFRALSPYHPPEHPQLGPRLPRQGYHHTPPLRSDPQAFCNGLWDALREHHILTDFVHEDGGLGDTRVLVLQSNAAIDDSLAERIREFVQAGGCLLAEGHASLLDEQHRRRSDFALADVFGVHFAGYTGASDVNYLVLDTPALQQGLPGYPLHSTGPAVRVRLDGAERLARLAPPLGGEQTIERHTASLFNPPGAVSQDAAITVHAYGEGRAIYVSSAIGDYLADRRDVDPWVKQLVANLIEVLHPAKLIRTDAPPGVEFVMNRVDDRYVLHLLNHYVASEHIGTGDAPRLDAFRVAFNERRLGRIESISVAPPERALSIEHSADGWAEVVVPPLPIHEVLIVRPTN